MSGLHPYQHRQRRQRQQQLQEQLYNGRQSPAKYRDVKTTLDTGYNARRREEKIKEIRENYKFKADEIFRRINVNVLVQLIVEIGKLEIQESFTDDRKLRRENGEPSSSDGMNNGVITAEEAMYYDDGVDSADSAFHDCGRSVHSAAFDLINGIGEKDSKDTEGSAANTGHRHNLCHDDRPYLLLDIRENPEEYSRSHLITANHYPASNLTKSVNFETRSMRNFKNAQGKIIVVYDLDEKSNEASKFATTLYQRGYDNVFMLSGGLRVAEVRYGETLITNQKDKMCLNEEEVLNLEAQLEETLDKIRNRVLSGLGSTSRLSNASKSMSVSQPDLNQRRYRN